MEETKVLDQIVKLDRLQESEEKQYENDVQQENQKLSKTDILQKPSSLANIKQSFDRYDNKKTESDQDSDDINNEFIKADKSSEDNGSNKDDETYETKDFVSVNKTILEFGKQNIYPGSIQEIDLAINLKEHILQFIEDDKPLMLRVIAKCFNQEFQDLDEYVFSVRTNEKYQYFEEVRYKIRRKQKAQIKVAVKIPPVQQNYQIKGSLTVQLQNLIPLNIPISAKCVVPKINCLKNLFNHSESSTVIKIPAKKTVNKIPPIPFKNLSGFNFPLELELLSHGDFSKRPYDIVCYGLINCIANGQFFVNIQLRNNSKFEGPKPLRDTIRKVLLLKVKNSSVYFHYPLQIHIYEGKSGSSN